MRSERRTSTGRAERELERAIAIRCRGRTMVLSGEDDDLSSALRQLGVAAESWDPFDREAAGPANQSCRTVVLEDLLERLPEAERSDLLERAWALVARDGLLIAVVPNRECQPKAEHDRALGRKDLRRLLKPLGRPQLATDQPYRWLVMMVRKLRSGAGLPNRTRRARYRATAKLCRGRVIELGCGEGHLTKVIYDRGLAAMGVDLSAAKIRIARELYPEIEYVVSDIRKLRMEAESFDTVVLAEVLEHVADGPGAEMLATAWKLLRPGGRLVVSVPNEDCIPHPNHVREFDRRGLVRLLRPLGRPRLVTDQPFQWLMMYVDKSGQATAP